MFPQFILWEPKGLALGVRFQESLKYHQIFERRGSPQKSEYEKKNLYFLQENHAVDWHLSTVILATGKAEP